MQLSIIIPTYNEEVGIEKLLTHLQKIKSENISLEIIIVDGGSTDNTVTDLSCFCHPDSDSYRNVEGLRQKTIILKSAKGRAKQLNIGAKNAKGEVLYFLHADTFPPKRFDETILKMVSEKIQAGSFRMKFDKDTLFFNFWSWFTRFKWNISSGGDQSLFITKKMFNQLKGFDEQWQIMEDIEIISRIKKETNYIKLPQKVVTSTRKYDKVGAIKLQTHFIIMHNLKMLRVPPEKLLKYYNRFITSTLLKKYYF